MIDFLTNVFLSEITILFIDGLALYLAFLVYRDNPEHKLNQLYVCMTFFMMLWINFAYLPRIIGYENPLYGLMSLKLAWFATPLFFTALYLVTIYMLNKQIKYRLLTGFIVSLGIISAAFTGLTNKIITNIAFVDGFLTIVYGPWMLVFLGLVFVIMLSVIVPIFREKALSNRRIQHYLTGIIIFYIANAVFNITFPVFFGYSRFYFIGDYSTIILLIFTAYGVLKYKMFNIKIVTTEILVYAVWLILATDVITADNWQTRITKLVLFVIFSIVGILLIRSVINEIKQRQKLQELNQKLETTNEKLKRSDAAKTEFMSIASHQLRTPITGIKGYLSMFLEGDFGKFSQKQTKIIEDVYNNTERLTRLINIFLNISRIEAGRLKVNKIKFNLIDSIKNCVEIIQNEIEKKGNHIQFKSKFKKAPLVADKDKLEDVIINLIDNANKYTEKGKITVSFQKNPSTYRVTVKDTGIGVKKEDLDKIFNKYSRIKKGELLNTSGHGLGLFIAKKIVELHKGKIWAESPGPNKGTSFIFEIPITKK